MTKPELRQKQELRQEQILAPQQIQSLEILATQSLELEAKLNQELAENPVLEIDENEPDSTKKEQEEKPQSEPDADPSENSEILLSESEKTEELVESVISQPRLPSTLHAEEDALPSYSEHELGYEAEEFESLTESYRGTEPDSAFAARNPDYEKKRQHFFDSITKEASLQEQLLTQLRMAPADAGIKKLAELVIGSIDERGYIRSHPADLATIAEVPIEKIESAIKLVQTFDPSGIGARTLKECLLLQLTAQGKSHGLLAQLVKHHLDDLAGNKLPQAARKMRISLSDLKKLILELKKLNPHPGMALSADEPVFAVPEATLEKRGNRFVVVMNKEIIPKIRISRTYLKLLEDPSSSEETKTYVKEKIIKAKNLIQSLAMRESTIKKITELIADTQFDFLEKGIDHLKPLTMQEVADKIGVHETTVSRAVANKFLQTPYGLLMFKFFFSAGYQSKSGDEISNKTVMEKIKNIIFSEDASDPISDQKISEILKKEGINVARRTVTKYRESVGIPSSHLRKEHL
jgi:RNA polymerase sigma-54 factor